MAPALGFCKPMLRSQENKALSSVLSLIALVTLSELFQSSASHFSPLLKQEIGQDALPAFFDLVILLPLSSCISAKD